MKRNSFIARKQERAAALLAAPELVKNVMIARYVYQLTDAEIVYTFGINRSSLRCVNEFLREFVVLYK